MIFTLSRVGGCRLESREDRGPGVESGFSLVEGSFSRPPVPHLLPDHRSCVRERDRPETGWFTPQMFRVGMEEDEGPDGPMVERVLLKGLTP